MTLMAIFTKQREELMRHASEVKYSETYKVTSSLLCVVDIPLTSDAGASFFKALCNPKERSEEEDAWNRMVCRRGDISFLSLFLGRVKNNLGKVSSGV